MSFGSDVFPLGAVVEHLIKERTKELQKQINELTIWKETAHEVMSAKKRVEVDRLVEERKRRENEMSSKGL